MKRLGVAMVVGLALAGCQGDNLEAVSQRLEVAQRDQRELEARTQVLTEEVGWMRKQIQVEEDARAAEERKLEALRDSLAESWRGDPAAMRERMKEAKVPPPLQAALQQAQEQKGGVAAERLFIEGTEKEDLKQVATALNTWELRTGVTNPPEASEAEAPEETCERQQVTFSCVSLPLEGPKDAVTQLCRMSDADSVWVLRSDMGSLARVNLIGSRHDNYRPVRKFSPEVWVLAGEDDSPTSPGTSNVSAKAWLEVFKLTGGSELSRQAVRRHALPLERQGQRVAMAELDLDADSTPEVLVLDGKEVRTLRYDARHDEVNLWTEAETCPLIEKRTEKELEPARAPCAAWAQARQPKDGGAR
ncbi:hypothetical protein [Hyalangium rubrum]|uniref:Lipoprotein n=1 Tax=Hyalangium rubrum TaxID=3103134 RepID=A0ABU5GYK0_9BACT|nr:hypothetical protein [Hyalangium sp. s54d21]MDY7226263.1 hypothetical protein [Hyalangium sp. s54d21]